MEFKKFALITAVIAVVSAALLSIAKAKPKGGDKREENRVLEKTLLAKAIAEPFGTTQQEGYTVEDFLNGL